MNLSIKTNYIKSFIPIIVICVVFVIQSCSESLSEILDEPNLEAGLSSSSIEPLNEYRFLAKTYKLPAGLTKWEAQLDKAIENNQQFYMRSGLELISYNYIRNVVSISDLETVKRDLNENRSFFVVLDEDNYTNFTLGENEAVSKNYMKYLNYLLPTSDSALAENNDNSVYIFEKSDMGIVNLTWQYKDETLNTTCLVSDRKGVIFDKILFGVYYKVKQ